VKTASKPLAAQFERYVMGHPFMRKRVISIAQVNASENLKKELCFWDVE